MKVLIECDECGYRFSYILIPSEFIRCPKCGLEMSAIEFINDKENQKALKDFEEKCSKIHKSKIDNGFDEWKAVNSSEIEELADYFLAHDSEGYFTCDKHKEAYEKIESLCRMAYERR